MTLESLGFQNNENLIVTVDLTKLPQLEVDETQLEKEKKALMPNNKGCLVDKALKMEKETVKADGNCLFNCATLALENTVSRPQETREILASVMMSDP